jgi:4-amino-4-deoxy-L-arabinose transferase-like glycosyltransferase
MKYLAMTGHSGDTPALRRGDPLSRVSAGLRRPGWLAAAGILAVLLGLRLWHVMVLPIYYDEALHIQRAQRMLDEGTLLMGTEGGKYLQVWLLGALLPLGEDPLLTGRVLSAAVGLLSGVGCYLLARRLYPERAVALVAVALVAICPYLLFFDRTSMADGTLCALAVWCLWLSLVVLHHRSPWPAVGLGMCLGLAVTAKLSGLIFLAFPLLVAWLWRAELSWRRSLSRLGVAWLIAAFGLLPTLLDLAPQLASTLERSWVRSEDQGIVQLVRLEHNLEEIVIALWAYLTPPLVMLGLVEVGRSWRRRARPSWLLALAALVILAFFLVTTGEGKFHYRYALPAFPFGLILAARAMVALSGWLWSRLAGTARWVGYTLLVGLALLVSLPALRFDYWLLTDPAQAAWTARDRNLFIDGSLAGYGVAEAGVFLRQQADASGMIIVVKRTDNEKRTGAWAYYLDRPNIWLQALNLKTADPQQLIQQLRAAPAPVFMVLDRPDEDRLADDFTEGVYASFASWVATFPRPGGASRIEVYRLDPNLRSGSSQQPIHPYEAQGDLTNATW